MSEALEAGRALGEALLAHPDHELFEGASEAELLELERRLGVPLPAVLRGLLLVGSGGMLATGDHLLGTKDPDGFGATLAEVAQGLWDEGLPRSLLPVVDGERFLCLDLAGSSGEPELVEVDPEGLVEERRLGPFVAWVRRELLGKLPQLS